MLACHAPLSAATQRQQPSALRAEVGVMRQHSLLLLLLVLVVMVVSAL
jgi:hypothetical protein